MRTLLGIALLLIVPAVTHAQQGSYANGLFYNWFHPGSVQQQRYRATLHDPYPDRDIAPEVVGGRPREFMRPLPEPVRNRYMTDSWWNR